MPANGKIKPRLAETRPIELNAWEAARLFHVMERGSDGSWTPEEHDLYLKLRRLFDVDTEHRGRESGHDPYPASRVFIPRDRFTAIPGR